MTTMPENHESIGISGPEISPEKKYGKFVIVGRAQTGKSSMAEILSRLTGLKILKTSTTRPKRSPDEDLYHFYSVEDAAKIPDDQKLFKTLAVDGFERWTNKSDFLEAGIAVLDPTGLAPAVRLWQAQGYRVSVIYCELPKNTRQTRWNRTVGGPLDDAILKFEHREQIESPMFDDLERMIKNIEDLDNADAMLYPNAALVRRNICGEDHLRIVHPIDFALTEGILRNFMKRLESEALPDSRAYHLGNDLILKPENHTRAEWMMLCELFGLLPEYTSRITIHRPVLDYQAGQDARNNQFKEDIQHG